VSFPVRPLRDVVYIKPEAPEERRGRIWVPECAQQRASCGTVVASGPGYEMLTGQVVPAFFEVGDRVVWRPHSATLVKVDGVEYWRTVHSNVEAVVSPEARVEA
jgi:co-chaperonin GroES (HSP10)